MIGVKTGVQESTSLVWSVGVAIKRLRFQSARAKTHLSFSNKPTDVTIFNFKGFGQRKYV